MAFKTNPEYLLTLAACGACNFHWPVPSLLPIKDYFERVDDGCPPEDEPDGDCPVTGSLCYAAEKSVPIFWMPLADAVKELNASGRALAAFMAFPSRRESVTVRLWSAPRHCWTHNVGILRDIVVKPNRAAVEEAVKALGATTSPAPEAFA